MIKQANKSAKTSFRAKATAIPNIPNPAKRAPISIPEF